jgi:hypothetical protein
MRLAEKQEDVIEEVTPGGSAPESGAENAYADGGSAPPAASLTAALIQRSKSDWRGAETATPELQAEPEVLEEAVGARAQQAVLEEAFAEEEVFAEPEPVVVAAPVERYEFQSVRESAAEWHLFRAPSAGFWDRLMKDVSIFTIFFAVLVFVILQIM